MSLSYIPNLLQLFVAVLSVFLFFKNKNKYTLYLMLLLWTTVVVEGLGKYFYEKKIDSRGVYHIYSLFEFNLISLVYLSVFKEKIQRFVVTFLMIVYSLLFFISYLLIEIQLFLVPIGAFFIAIILIIYLSELLKSDKILNYKNEPLFWVTIGFLIFYLPSIPFFTMQKFMQGRGLFFIIYILVAVMNLFIAYGLLCSKEKTSY